MIRNLIILLAFFSGAAFGAPRGKVVELSRDFESRHLGNARAIWAYLPPSYEAGNARYPVVYMQDGQTLFAGGWEVASSLDALYAGQNPPREAIIVAVAHAGADRITEFGDKTALYLKFLREELKPRIDQGLRTLPDARNTGIIGSSMGGLAAAFAACTEPESWGFVGIFSPSVWWKDRMILGLVPDLSRARVKPARIYVDSGEDGKADTVDLARAFQAVGYRSADQFRYVYRPGDQHNEAAWARRFPGAIRFLLGPRTGR